MEVVILILLLRYHLILVCVLFWFWYLYMFFHLKKKCFIILYTNKLHDETDYRRSHLVLVCSTQQYDYLIPPGIQVTKTDNMLQIPVMAHNQEAKLLSVRFRDHIDEEQFILAVSEKIGKWDLTLKSIVILFII